MSRRFDNDDLGLDGNTKITPELVAEWEAKEPEWCALYGRPSIDDIRLRTGAIDLNRKQPQPS